MKSRVYDLYAKAMNIVKVNVAITDLSNVMDYMIDVSKAVPTWRHVAFVANLVIWVKIVRKNVQIVALLDTNQAIDHHWDVQHANQMDIVLWTVL